MIGRFIGSPVMVAFVVAEMLLVWARAVLAVAGRHGPGRLRGQEHHQNNEQQFTHAANVPSTLA